jgi:hypothetical protein
MPSQLVPPPPTQSTLASQVGLPTPPWARWFQQLWDKLHGGTASGGNIIPRLIIATSVSTIADFGSLEAGDRVLIVPAVAGNASFVTVAVNGALPVAAVVGGLYVVLRAF